MTAPLTISQYTQPEVLQVTRLRPAVLQTWMNRDAIKLSDQNPGYGRRRLYSALDVVKLAVMRRMADLQIALGVAREVAEAAADELVNRGGMDWDLYLTFRPSDATQSEINVKWAASDKLTPYAPTIGDPINMLIYDLVYPLEQGRVLPRRNRKPLEHYQDSVIDPERREALARQGIHAEPAIIFPLGEIVNGVLAQLTTLDEVRAK